MPIVLIVVVVVLVLTWRRRNREVAPPASIGALPWVEGMNWRVTGPLLRAETRHLVKHPAFLVGIAITPLIMALSTLNDQNWEAVWIRSSPAIALGLVPLGWMMIIATNLLTLRPRRNGADELFAAAPAPQPVRTSGLLLLTVPAAAVAGIIAIATVVIIESTKHPFGSVNIGDVLTGVLIVSGAVTVGVAVARFLPWPAFGFAAVVAVIMIQARFFELAAWPWNRTEADPARFLAFMTEATSTGTAALEVRPSSWHVVYLLGLIAVMACVALARDRFPRRFAAVAMAAVAVVGISGWLQVRPPSDARVAAMVAYLTEPEPHQDCVNAQTMTVCAYPEHIERVPGWQSRATAVRALLPADIANRPLRITDRVRTVVGNRNCSPIPFLDAVHPAVADSVTPAAVWPADGDVHPGVDTFPCSSESVQELFTAIQVGSWAVGLPPSPHGADVRCLAAGQARAVVALWLGAITTPKGDESLRSIATEHGGGLATFSGWNDPPMFGATFASADMDLALELLRLPRENVRSAVAASWNRLVDPATSSAVLGDLLPVDRATATAAAASASTPTAPAAGAATCS